MTSSQHPTVFFAKAGQDLRNALRRLLVSIYGDQKPWINAKEVLIKPNAVNFEPHVFVEPKVIGALVALMKEDGVDRVSVMESCTNGSFTRLVFKITGIDKQVKQNGGRCVYLDEGRADRIDLGDAGKIRISRFLADRLIHNRADVFYIDLAKLKTHSMTTVTLCLKNQWGFVDPLDRGALHNDFLHKSIRAVNRVFVPDLAMVEGLIATNHGHFPLKGYESETLWEAGILVAGTNAVAVDSACCQLIGIDPTGVEHIALSATNPEQLSPNVEHLDPISPPPAPFTDTLHSYFPKDVSIHKGAKRCCKEGCYSNPVCAVQVLGANYGGHGGFHLFLGKGHAPEEINACQGPVLVVGPCAQNEVYDQLVERLGKKNVQLSTGHNNLKETIRQLMPMMGIKVTNASPLPLYKLLTTYARHRMARSRADIGFI